MVVLLRELRDGPAGAAAYHDREVASQEISIGGASDQEIRLLGRDVGARHAVIRAGAGGPSLVCLAGLKVAVNGEERTSATLEIGDRIEVGGHRLTVVQAPAGFDLAIELRLNAEIGSSAFEAAFRTDLEQTWLRHRRTVWLLIAVTALFGLVVPLAVVRARRGVKAMPTWLPTWLSDRVPTDALWSPGPLAPGHRQIIGERCAACHQSLFTLVQDGACRECHRDSNDHLEPALLAQTSLGPTQRCASCHREHEEPTGNLIGSDLIDRSDRLCVDCHANSTSTFGALEVQPVGGFGAGRHPPFSSRGQILAAWKDGSGLKFSHPQHLDADRVRRTGDRAPLGCADCHALSTDGEHFDLINMARNCSSCHELTFDPDAPDRQLPHGKPREVARTLLDYFARKLSDPRAVTGAGREQRRLPEREAKDTTCKGSAWTCAMRMTLNETENQFLRRGCVSCHRVRDTKSKDLAGRFQVIPIRLVRDYFPDARFPHRRHLVQGQAAGDAACLTCHPANNPGPSDMLLPDLPTCETCHADTPARNRTRLQCVSCHDYHPHS